MPAIFFVFSDVACGFERGTFNDYFGRKPLQTTIRTLTNYTLYAIEQACRQEDRITAEAGDNEEDI